MGANHITCLRRQWVFINFDSIILTNVDIIPRSQEMYKKASIMIPFSGPPNDYVSFHQAFSNLPV